LDTPSSFPTLLYINRIIAKIIAKQTRGETKHAREEKIAAKCKRTRENAVFFDKNRDF